MILSTLLEYIEISRKYHILDYTLALVSLFPYYLLKLVAISPYLIMFGFTNLLTFTTSSINNS